MHRRALPLAAVLALAFPAFAEDPPKPAADDARAAFEAFEKLHEEWQTSFRTALALRREFLKAQDAYLKERNAAVENPKLREDPQVVAKMEAMEKALREKHRELQKSGLAVEAQGEKVSDAVKATGPKLEAAIKAKPDDASVRLLKVKLLCAVGEFPTALPDAELVAKARPDDPAARLGLARCLLGSNRYDEGTKLLEELAKGDGPAAREPKARLALAYYSLNRFADAKAALKDAGDEATLPLDVARTLEGWDIARAADLWTRESELRKKETEKNDLPRVKLETTRGDVVLELFEDEAPNTVANFLVLVERGFYDGTKFHRVLPNFMAQGGDPKGTGEGGPGYRIKDELEEAKLRRHFRGALSMANTGQPDTGGSQFFITVRPTPELDGRHCVFGRVVEGQDVVDGLRLVDPERPDAAVKPDQIKKASVVRKRAHEYKPETLK